MPMRHKFALYMMRGLRQKTSSLMTWQGNLARKNSCREITRLGIFNPKRTSHLYMFGFVSIRIVCLMPSPSVASNLFLHICHKFVIGTVSHYLVASGVTLYLIPTPPRSKVSRTTSCSLVR